MTDSLKRYQAKIKSVYNSIGGKLKKTTLPNLLSISRWLLKKSFENYGLAIVNIMEHDIDADNTTYSGPFDSVDGLMNHLNS